MLVTESMISEMMQEKKNMKSTLTTITLKNTLLRLENCKERLNKSENLKNMRIKLGKMKEE
tara:strand:+ start:552 stop:734 length:183 start_codon:yes stop_codon:yes gene_type:complete